ncbi:MAG: methyltransferase domain-containing protein [Myxococcales bacterium]|nr:methyltransferase domain-containing protein [Myxococcales bacterium]
MVERKHRVRVSPLPPRTGSQDLRRLLGPTGDGDPQNEHWLIGDGEPRTAEAELTTALAADLDARLRGLGLEGRVLQCEIDPPLRRGVVRQARTEDARRRRDTTAGFERRGTRVDEEGRWSLTPERLALRMAGWAEGRPVVDAGCGAGGNAIAFSRAGCPVIAIERDAGRLALARHNAAIYGVADRIRFVAGDAGELAVASLTPGSILFVDPPWGTQWSRERTGLADLALLATLAEAFVAAAPTGASLWAKVPPSFVSAELEAALGRSVAVRFMFGEADGDRRRIKFLLLRADPA